MCMLMVRCSQYIHQSVSDINKNFTFRFIDINNLLVNNDFPMITGIQNDDIVIPCKPTSKNITVKLIKEGDEVNEYVRTLSIFVLVC